MTSWPCSASNAAATDESTPPDIATMIFFLSANGFLQIFQGVMQRVNRELRTMKFYFGQTAHCVENRLRRNCFGLVDGFSDEHLGQDRTGGDRGAATQRFVTRASNF